MATTPSAAITTFAEYQQFLSEFIASADRLGIPESERLQTVEGLFRTGFIKPEVRDDETYQLMDYLDEQSDWEASRY